MSVSVKDTVLNWRAGIYFNVKDNVQIWSRQYYDMLVNGQEFAVDGADADDKFSAVSIYIMLGDAKAGTDDKNNDCVYNCINQIDPKAFYNAVELKNKLGLKRNDKVSIDDIPKIEEYLKDYKINVSGDVKYFSNKNCKKTISLVFVNGHCTLNETAVNKIILPTTDKKVYFYYEDPNER